MLDETQNPVVQRTGTTGDLDRMRRQWSCAKARLAPPVQRSRMAGR